MDILVTFEDGTKELRAARSPVVEDVQAGEETSPHRWPTWQPANGLVLVPSAGGWRVSNAIPPQPIEALRGRRAIVWRITGGWGEKEPLAGEWQSCRVETVGEQIARLTAERDAEKARADRMTRCFAAVGRLTVKVGRKWHSERERADAAEMARDEARVALVQLLALWGWRADNGGFVSVNDLGDWAVTCSIADDIAYRDLLDDMKRLRAIVAEQGATLGDLINARARAGAEMVDAREALARLKKDDKARPAAEERLARAETAYQRAQAAESASAE